MKGDGIRALLQIGTQSEGVRGVADAILRILSAPHTDEETKRAALKALGEAVSPNVSISNSTFSGPI